MTNKTEYTQLKLRDLKILAAEKGVQPVGDLRKKETWLLALFAHDIAEAELYTPTSKEYREYLEHCYGQPDTRLLDWLDTVAVNGSINRDELQRLTTILETADYISCKGQGRVQDLLMDLVYYSYSTVELAEEYRRLFGRHFSPLYAEYRDRIRDLKLDYEDYLEQEERDRGDYCNQEYEAVFGNMFNEMFPGLASFLAPPTCWEILELTPGVPVDEVKRSYKRLAKIHHPDMPTGNCDRFRVINEAYQECLECFEAIPF